MRAHAIAAILVVVVLVFWLMRPASVTAPGDVPARPAAARLAPLATPPPAGTPSLTRDPFRYADSGSEAPQLSGIAPPPPVPEPGQPLPAATPEPVRLNGLVWRAGVLRAALSVHGTTVVAAAGDSAEGYLVISVDEDAGVHVRGPSGEELRLRPAR